MQTGVYLAPKDILLRAKGADDTCDRQLYPQLGRILAACYRTEPGAIVLSVRLTPKSRRDQLGEVVRLADGRLAVRVHVRALPEDGEANRALARLLADTFDVPKSAITVVAGTGARLKQVRIAGEVPALAAIVAGWPAPV